MKEIIPVALLSILIFFIYLLFRNWLIFKYRGFWLDVVYAYRMTCIYAGIIPKVNFSDIREYNDFFMDLTCFSKDSMIPDKEKLRILRTFLEEGMMQQ